MVELLRRLVDVPSHATQPAGVARVAQLLAEQLEPFGFQFEEHRPGPLPPELSWLETIMSPEAPYHDLASSYVARRAGAAPGRLLLLGDLDTAAPEGAATAMPFEVRGTRAYGAGVADMKGGLVVMVMALRALAELAAETPAMGVVLAGDEQAGSLSSRRLVESEARSADWCLCVECARDGGRLMHARAHIGVGRLEARGREAHAGSNHAQGGNAIEALSRAIPALNAITQPDAGIYVTVTLVTGGRRRSVVPGHAVAVLDIRTPNAEAWAPVRDRIEEATRTAAIPGVELTVRVHDHRPGFGPGPRSEALLALIGDAGQRVGMVVESQASSAAGSSAFAGAMGVPTVDGLGPSGGDLMTPGEYVDIRSLSPRAALLAASIHALGS